MPKLVAVIPPILFAFAAFGADAVDYTVTVAEPASGELTIELTCPVQDDWRKQPFELTFPDLRDVPNQLKSITFYYDGGAIEPEISTTENGLTAAGPPLDNTKTLRVRYRIDPEFHAPGSDQRTMDSRRGWLDESGGILRTRTIFPKGPPNTLLPVVTFQLPTLWRTATPWLYRWNAYRPSPATFQETDYLAVGPFRVEAMNVRSIPFKVAVHHDADDVTPAELRDLLAVQLDWFGHLPYPRGVHRTVVVVPQGAIRGGAAGAYSIVQPPSWVVLAHEMAHWWNRGGKINGPSEWFHEGFTQYYGIRSAQAAGLITGDEAQDCFADLQGEMRYLETGGPVSLLEASQEYDNDPRMRRLVYAKGAMLAYTLDDTLSRQDQALTTAVRAILHARAPTGLGDVVRMFRELYGRETGDMLARFLLEPKALPEVPLGPADGSSGCARFLPDKGTQR